ncbi:unnamed protein product [Caenorhabditis auriculariae]|uniref:Trafficking protein particle complex subunit 2-like protein n=1 Tax=Caenorhabditis auriculariae TaxID=2777116 RepID=A0A8S1H027_9PELO|nr:unnamed protein product [Caenorhabditis auriculariae]
MAGIIAIYIYGRENSRLFHAVNPEELGNVCDIEMFVFCSLDIVDEKVVKSNEMYLGQLFTDQRYKSFGFVTNTGVKIVLVVDFLNSTLKDQDVRSIFKRFHVFYCKTISNPFYTIGSPLHSRWLDDGCKEIFAKSE